MDGLKVTSMLSHLLWFRGIILLVIGCAILKNFYIDSMSNPFFTNADEELMFGTANGGVRVRWWCCDIISWKLLLNSISKHHLDIEQTCCNLVIGDRPWPGQPTTAAVADPVTNDSRLYRYHWNQIWFLNVAN